ncbi:GspMb/PilO family protein [Pontiella sp.]|uniref:GspMb/PilO family protein n=1 Tax=Pontiella sp. TaxID=2837462 RepID=UPI00356A1E90
MKKMFLRMSRRERLYLVIGATVLFLGLVVYPATKKAAAYREEQRQMLEDEMLMLNSLDGLYLDEGIISDEHQALRTALREADDLLFPPIENQILTQTAMIKLFNELGPDLNLQTTAGRSAVGDASNQMNLSVRGEGRYAEILKFIHRIETYRPLILIENFSIEERRSRGRRSRFTSTTDDSEPTLRVDLSIQIICQEGGEK